MRWDFINTHVHLYINIYCILDERTLVPRCCFYRPHFAFCLLLSGLFLKGDVKRERQKSSYPVIPSNKRTRDMADNSPANRGGFFGRLASFGGGGGVRFASLPFASFSPSLPRRIGIRFFRCLSP